MDKTPAQRQKEDERPPPLLPLKRVRAHRLLGGPPDYRGETGELREENWILFRYIKGCLVLLTRRLSSRRAAEAAAILSDPNTYGDRNLAYRCFSPGFAFTFGTGDSAVHVQVCLDCLWVVFHTASGPPQGFVPSPEGLSKLKALYQRTFPFYILKPIRWLSDLEDRWLRSRRAGNSNP